MTQQRIRRYSEFPDEFDVDPDDIMPKQALQSTLATRTSNFVAPTQPVTAITHQEHQTNPVKTFDLSGLPTVHTSAAIDQSDELQRSKGFVWRVAPLSLGFGAGVGGVVLLAGGNATGAIVALFLCFAVVWAGAFVYHISRSPSGIAYMQSKTMWGVIREEQRYRHSVDWHERTKGR